ncbi:PREDICTED: protein LURP-one-related 8-like isoform X2 [Nelumbo nucifera]|uniref:Protein LURP-one-related 8-like isoform X2 n=2 Tax=Nelumbo nucifera TaxID=4432 RepID=A0A1U8BP26_NELNU|nr:PREDICTED: protein LURP-one-related 8-like isoform X2 [Nelumbo nucifera]DAD38527.1 TPA_asm: hypothetical protein HUJ06_012849 [Nelumbo nucifera]
MSKVHPTVANHHQNRCSSSTSATEEELVNVSAPSVFTVWKKSSMTFQGTDGFTVFNHEGKLAFRVDNYSRKTCPKGGLLLMDGAGRPLLTLKPQGYKGEGCYNKSPVFCMRRRSIFPGNGETEAFMGVPRKRYAKTSTNPDFQIEGSFRKRHCKIIGHNGTVAAEISRKKVNNTTILLSDDVFNLVVQPGFDCELVMAFVVIMDRICPKLFTPILCF